MQNRPQELISSLSMLKQPQDEVQRKFKMMMSGLADINELEDIQDEVSNSGSNESEEE